MLRYDRIEENRIEDIIREFLRDKLVNLVTNRNKTQSNENSWQSNFIQTTRKWSSFHCSLFYFECLQDVGFIVNKSQNTTHWHKMWDDAARSGRIRHDPARSGRIRHGWIPTWKDCKASEANEFSRPDQMQLVMLTQSQAGLLEKRDRIVIDEFLQCVKCKWSQFQFQFQR